MGLDECMEKHTDAQLPLWVAYLDMEMNVPGKVESYIMSLTMEVRLLSERVRTLMGGKIVEPKMEQFRLTFGVPRASATPRSKEEAASVAKQVWTTGLGMDVVHKTRTRTEARAMGLID